MAIASKPAPRVWCLLPALLLVVTAGCGGGGSRSGSQVAVKVNDGEITAHQIELLSQRELAARPAEAASAVKRQVLDTLVEQEIAAQAARKAGIDSMPQVVQLMEIAKREVLARAWQDQTTALVTGPSSDEIDRYYEEHPALFAQRKIYSLTETVVEVEDASKVAALKARIEGSDGPTKLQEALAVDGVRSSSRNLRASAEELPMAILDKVAAMRDGQSLAVPRDGGLRVLTVIGTQAAKVERLVAKPMIESYLINERKVAVSREQMSALRKSAAIDYKGPYAAVQAGDAASAPK